MVHCGEFPHTELVALHPVNLCFAHLRDRTKENYPMRALFAKLIDDEAGVTAVEYGLIAALIAVAAVTIMTTVGTNLSTTFSKVAAKL